MPVDLYLSHICAHNPLAATTESSHIQTILTWNTHNNNGGCFEWRWTSTTDPNVFQGGVDRTLDRTLLYQFDGSVNIIFASGTDSCICCTPAECQACSIPPVLSSSVGLVPGGQFLCQVEVLTPDNSICTAGLPTILSSVSSKENHLRLYDVFEV